MHVKVTKSLKKLPFILMGEYNLNLLEKSVGCRLLVIALKLQPFAQLFKDHEPLYSKKNTHTQTQNLSIQHSTTLSETGLPDTLNNTSKRTGGRKSK